MRKLLKNTDENIPIKYHVIFWVCYFCLNFIRWGIFYDNFYHSFRSNVLEFALHILITYFTVYYLIPKFILTKKYLTFIFFFIIALCIVYVLKTEISLRLFYTDTPEFDMKVFKTSYKSMHIFSTIVGEIYVVTFSGAIKFTVDWIIQKNKYENLKETQLKSELEFLKAQIQPHFFFNTLNNLYALTLEKSKKAPEVVLKLSEIMEYVLYTTREPEIRLIREIDYIQNYIDLERLRFGNEIDVELNVQGDIETHNVPPLLFLPFIENCFKHGKTEKDKVKIIITINVSETSYLTFSIKNNYNQFTKNSITGGNKNNNVIRRLKLLYGDNFTLETKKEKENYIVQLAFQL